MTVEKVRELVKVHIKAAEASGRFEVALSLLEVLDAIDAEIAIDKQRQMEIKSN